MMIEDHKHKSAEDRAENLRGAGYGFRITHRTIEVKRFRKRICFHENYPDSQSGSVPRADYEADCHNNLLLAIAAADEHLNEAIKAYHRAQLAKQSGR